MAKDSGTQAMETLQNKWYNALVAGLRLDDTSFQLVQASQPLPNTSKGIWSIFNSIPPLSLTQTFALSQFNNFYDDYVAVITTILPQGGDQFRIVMGDNLAAWNDYKKTLKPGDLQSLGGLLGAFKSWAQLNLDPDVASKAVTIMSQMQNSVVNKAVEAANNADYVDATNGPKFTKTIQDLRDALTHGERRALSFDSSTASADVQHTWAKGSVSGIYEFFTGSAGGSYDQLSVKAASSQVQIEATFESVVSFAASPDGWYSSAALNLAYSTADNTVWPAGQSPTWNATFGSQGNMQRVATELVVADGIEATIVSSASYSTEEQRNIQASASIGFWPFFSFGASGGNSSNVTFDDSGKMTVRISVPKGNPGVLGVNVLSMARMLGH